MEFLHALYYYDRHGLIGSHCFREDLKRQSGKPGDRIEGKAWIQGAPGKGMCRVGFRAKHRVSKRGTEVARNFKVCTRAHVHTPQNPEGSLSLPGAI